MGCPTPPGHSGRVPGVGEGGVRRETDRGHGAGEGEGLGQRQDCNVIKILIEDVLRMGCDPGDCPEVHGGVGGIMFPHRHAEIGP